MRTSGVVFFLFPDDELEECEQKSLPTSADQPLVVEVYRERGYDIAPLQHSQQKEDVVFRYCNLAEFKERFPEQAVSCDSF